ncbi:MAG: hypothetical protein VW270_16895 [Candidatus Poseidoniales archaeon]
MADNINVTAGSGKTIGADEISSVLYQRIKIVEGADGTNDGDVSATNPLPVELRDVDTTLVADVGAIKTSVQTLDNAISGNEMQVDVLTMPTTTVQATDLDVRDLTSTDVVTVTGGVGQTADVKVTLDSENVAVTGTVTANAGTNLNTSALALETGGNLATLAGKDFATQTTLAAINAKLVTGTDIGDVTINNGSGANAVNIQDGGNTITVDGTVTANTGLTQPLTDTQLRASDVKITLDGESVPVTNTGTFAVQVDGSALTSLQLIDDAIYTAGSGTPSKGTLALGSDGTNPRAIAVDTSGNLQVDIVSGGSSGTQYTEGDTDASITGTAALVEGAANALAVLTQPLTDTQLRASDVKITLDGESVPVTGTFWQATQPVSGTLAVTQSGTWDEVGINDSGNSITVDYATTGSGTATGALRVELPTNGTGVIATVGAVTAITNALPAGSNAIGKLAANSGVDIGDVDILSVIPGTGATNLGKAEDAAHSSGDTGVMSLGVRTDTPDTAKSGADGDYTPIATTSTGALRIAPISEDFAVLANGPQVKKYYTNAGAVTDGIVWSPAAGKRWYITDLIINVSAAATVTLEDDKAGGDEAVMKFELAANSGVSHSFNTPLFSGEDAADLIVTTSAGNVYITITGYEI